jgi:hypothetical protein
VLGDVRFGSKADIASIKRDVRFTPKSGHQALTSTHPDAANARSEAPALALHHGLRKISGSLGSSGAMASAAATALLALSSKNRRRPLSFSSTLPRRAQWHGGGIGRRGGGWCRSAASWRALAFGRRPLEAVSRRIFLLASRWKSHVEQFVERLAMLCQKVR